VLPNLYHVISFIVQYMIYWYIFVVVVTFVHWQTIVIITIFLVLPLNRNHQYLHCTVQREKIANVVMTEHVVSSRTFKQIVVLILSQHFGAMYWRDCWVPVNESILLGQRCCTLERTQLKVVFWVYLNVDVASIYSWRHVSFDIHSDSNVIMLMRHIYECYSKVA